MLARNAEGLSDFERRLCRLTTIAQIMDTALVVPGTNIRFGADSLLGLIPGAGDFVGAVISFAIINEVRRLGAPNALLARMIFNVGLDAVLGAVPLLGDAFDVYFKANQRNAQLVLEHFNGQR